MASQPAAGALGIKCLEVPSFVRGYHAYKDIWEPENGEMLELKRERENCKDINAVAVVKDNRTVGHVPKNLAPHFSFFLARDFNKGLCEVAGIRVNRGGGYGLEILCVFRLYGPKWFVECLERLIDLPNNISVRTQNRAYTLMDCCYCMLLPVASSYIDQPFYLAYVYHSLSIFIVIHNS